MVCNIKSILEHLQEESFSLVFYEKAQNKKKNQCIPTIEKLCQFDYLRFFVLPIGN